MGLFGHNQLLVTGQVGLCTSDGSAIVCTVASYQIDSLCYHTKNRLSGDNWVIWHILVLSRVGVQGDRPLKMFCQCYECTLSTKWVSYKGLVR